MKQKKDENSEDEPKKEFIPKKNYKKTQAKIDIYLDLFYIVKDSVEEMGVPLFDKNDFGVNSFFHLRNKE